MKIPITFNKIEWGTFENMQKLLSIDNVKGCDFEGAYHCIEIETLQELDEFLTDLDKVFDYPTAIISGDNLEIFIDFREW